MGQPAGWAWRARGQIHRVSDRHRRRQQRHGLSLQADDIPLADPNCLTRAGSERVAQTGRDWALGQLELLSVPVTFSAQFWRD